MKERMNETYSIRSDSCIKRGTKTCRCASVTDGMIMKCSDFLFLFPGSFIIPVPLCCPPPPLFPVSAPGRADFGMIRNETLHLDFNCGVITGLNVQVVAGISRWFQGAKSATANCVCVFFLHFSPKLFRLRCLPSLWFVYHLTSCAGGHRRISAADYMRLLSPQ